MSKSLLFFFTAILLSLNACQEKQNYIADYDYWNSVDTSTYESEQYIDCLRRSCDSVFFHPLNLNFTCVNFNSDSLEIICCTHHQLLYRGYEYHNIKSAPIISCEDSSNFEVFEIAILDHKRKKAFRFSKKQSYTSCNLNNVHFFLFKDGDYILFNNNWLFD